MEARRASDTGPRVRVAFIAGTSWSGSTLLEQALAQIDGWVSVGELYWLWDPRWPQMTCECGEEFRECAFWQAVLEEAYGPSAEVIRAEIHARGAGLLRHSILPTLAHSSSRFRPTVALRELGAMVEPAYRAVRTVSGATTIIDASKCGLWGLAISMVEVIDLRVVHLVRDPMGFAASDSHPRELPFPPGAVRPPRPETRSLITWLLLNIEAELLGRRVAKRSRVLFQDLLSAPSTVSRRVAGLLGTDADLGRVFSDHTLTVRRTGHAIGGNPSRPGLGRTTVARTVPEIVPHPRAVRMLRRPLVDPLWKRYQRSALPVRASEPMATAP